jgi:enterochelin esterase-like enzyme
MLVVMPDANTGGAAFDESGLKKFESEINNTIIPFIEKNYRAKTDANSRALAGLSMGGIHTLYTGIKHTDTYSYLGVFSSGWITPNQNEIANNQYEFLKNNSATINTNLKQFWISMGGKEDIAYKNCQIMLGKFDEIKIKYTYSEYPGGHSWPVWRNNLYNFAQLLFK